jgi:transcriptional regulator with XRE-family HTH domain
MPGKPGPHSSFHDAFGRAVRETRARRNLSQEELGCISGLHRNYVGAVERGEINPTLRVILKLTTGLHIEASELVRLTELRHHERPAHPAPPSPQPNPQA